MRIAIVGLGTIAEHHVRALEELPDARVVGVVDPALGKELAFRGVPVARYSTAGELLARERIDVAIVATPTSTHAAVAEELARLSSCRILIEKPLAAELSDVRRLLGRGFPGEVQTLFHAAVAPEMNWATSALPRWLDHHGDISGIDVFLADGCVSEREHLRDALGDAWLDLGINALSIVSRLVSLESVDLTLVDRPRETYGGRFHFGSRSASGAGSVLVTWAGLEPSKHSALRFDDGARLLLDHQAGAGVLTAGNRIEDLFVLDDARPRLQWHYINLFERVLGGDRIFDPRTELDLHDKLLSAVGR